MNRRKFVSSLGSTTLFSAIGLNHQPGFAALSAGDLSLRSEPAQAPGANEQASPAWPRPVIVPIPSEVAGVPQPVIDLGGKWKFSLRPPAEFWANRVDPAQWINVMVPGELTAQGVPIVRDSEYAYKLALSIPPSAKDKKVFLRFDGVYSYARVWVNGKYVREHHGGFTSWDCDITELVTPGQMAWLTVGVTDRADEISYASNYAKHYIGGILRGVRLLILPADCTTRFHTETKFDSSYKNAQLFVTAAMSFQGGGSAQVNLRLLDPEGNEVPLAPQSMGLTSENPETVVEIPISAPAKWDAEHPRLYTLEATVVVDGHERQKLSKRVGFRQVERRKNKLYVNGDEVKLRGVCRHDTHPLRGRCVTPEIDWQDAQLLRDANVNFVRTSHYPPTESFLEACDHLGIYVEEETAICFVNQTWSIAAPTESNPDFTSRFVNQFAEMIERDRSHPSVIIWSLGNESHWGTNFGKEREYLKAADPSRPGIFSYPETVTAGADGYDIYSKHYPRFDGDLTSKDFPKLNDECIHLACYDIDTLKRDPGVRDYWGHFLKRFWENCYTSEGCLGGAIWAGFDEVFLLPDSPVGYGAWGIVDEWRRPKPEYWHTKKAYSPIRIDVSEVPNPGAGQPLEIPIKNWFNHTNLSEVRVTALTATRKITPRFTDTFPGAAGKLVIPGENWKDGDTLELEFFLPGKMLTEQSPTTTGKHLVIPLGGKGAEYHAAGPLRVDHYLLTIGKRLADFPPAKGPAPRVMEDNQTLTVQGHDFHIIFSKATGLISEGVFRGKKILEGGPFLNLAGARLSPWWLINLQHSTTPDEVVINLIGAHVARRGSGPGMSTLLEIRIDGQGLITTEYTLRNAVKDIDEVGIAYVLSSAINRLSWARKALWSAYPNDHIGRPRGTALRNSNDAHRAYRQEPAGPWANDEKDFFLYGPDDPARRGTNDFRSFKEKIWWAACTLEGTPLAVRAESDGTASVRAEVLPDGKVQININNLWAYTDLNYGVSMPRIALDPGYKNTVRIRLTEIA
jgi:hypothetical protein